MTEKTRFYALDGIRGLAAISILLFHYTEHNDLNWFKAAPMAVDLFFILSGFVVMHGYGDRILQGMGLGHFLRQRLLRLWPLYMVGLVTGLIAIILRQGVGCGLMVSAALNSFMLPDFSHLFEGNSKGIELFPFNWPAWSLFFEVAVNIAFFAYVTIRRKTDFRVLCIDIHSLCAADRPGQSRLGRR